MSVSGSNAKIGETKSTSDSHKWKGFSLNEILKSHQRYDFQELPLIDPSATHTVLFRLPITDIEPPEPILHPCQDKWSPEFVKMPHSPKNLCPIQRTGKKKEFRNRWEMIREALRQNITSSAQLESALLFYNPESAQNWEFSVLHQFFNEVASKEQTEEFFETLLPKIIDLALKLPTLITAPIPLLQKYKNASISLSQLQAASLIANAFLCTFPRFSRPDNKNYNQINFNNFFSVSHANKPHKRIMRIEKLKFILNYFKRVTTKMPKGTITFRRRYIPQDNLPKWDQQSKKLPALHITNEGTIETEGAGFLRVDFADKFIGGLLLGWGCVQEEILFLLHPELIVSMLVTEVLDETEAIIVSGVERFNKYVGYSDSLKWAGDFSDDTPRDQSGRRKSSFVAIDATIFKEPFSQFRISKVLRELNKAFVGFSDTDSLQGDLSPVSTGNWGCGVFKGDPKLKVLLQLMAAGISERPVVYFTFGDTTLRDSVSDMYFHLVQHNINIGQLFSLIVEFAESTSEKHQDFYGFLYDRIQ